MRLHDIQITPGSRKVRHRVGRGDGSGWGGTAGRGEKGQKSRTGSSIRHHFEGGQTPSFRRIPKRGFNSGIKEIFNVVNVDMLDKAFEAGAEVTSDILRQKGLIGKAVAPLKILGNGEISKALTVKAEKFSATAKSKIEAAGGKAEEIA
ncbi:MAG: 50S ribosomal protein L15 [Lentisphaeria bacterium]|nr:50S ribosomal protein L15 [Lentisphaeria bacterium]